MDRAGFWGNQIKRGGLFVIPLGSPRAQESLKRADTEAIHPEPNEQHVTLRRDAATDLLSAAAAQPARIRQSRRDRRVMVLWNRSQMPLVWGDLTLVLVWSMSLMARNSW